MIITVNNIEYQLGTINKTAKIINYKDELTTEIVIPEYIEYEDEKYKVAEIGDWVFSHCYRLTSITIPNSVNYIGNSVFKDCPLKEVRIPKNCNEFYNNSFKKTVNVIIDENNPYYFNYQDFIFKFIDDENISLTRYQGNDSKLQIPEIVNYKEKDYKVTEIGDDAFRFCSSLTSINIPNSVNYIGNSVFFNCQLLTSINIPNSVYEFGNYAFDCCSSLTSITIPNSITEIGIAAFAGCNSLTSITIPESVTSIGYSAFSNCYSLTSVTIPNRVTKIGDWAFYGCSSLTSITIPNRVTEIGYNAFSKCKNLTSINIPNSATKIEINAFDKIGLTLPKRYTKDDKLIAYKAFKVDMTCRNFQYEEGKTFVIEGLIKLCNCGFHACTNPLDVFNYYCGEIGKDIVVHEVYLSGDIDEDNNDDSKICASKIEIGRRLTMKDINEIINSK